MNYYQLDSAYSEDIPAKVLQLNTFAKSFANDFGLGTVLLAGEEQILNKIRGKDGINSQLKAIGINTKFESMSAEEKHDYLKLLYLVLQHGIRDKDQNMPSILSWAKNMKLYVGTIDNTKYYNMALSIVDKLKTAVLNQSMHTNFEQQNYFFDRVNLIFNIQKVLKSVEERYVSHQISKSQIALICDAFCQEELETISDNYTYTTFERAYLYFALAIARAIHTCRIDDLKKLKNISQKYDCEKFNPPVVYHLIYNNFNYFVSCYEEYAKTLNNFFNKNVKLISNIIFGNDSNDITERKIVKNKAKIINMVLISAESNATFTDLYVRVELLIPAAFLIVKRFTTETGGTGRIIDEKVSDETPLYKYKNKRISAILGEYEYKKFSPRLADHISNLLLYANAIFLGKIKQEKEAWEVEEMLSKIIYDIFERCNLSLTEAANTYLSKLLKIIEV